MTKNQLFPGPTKAILVCFLIIPILLFAECSKQTQKDQKNISLKVNSDTSSESNKKKISENKSQSDSDSSIITVLASDNLELKSQISSPTNLYIGLVKIGKDTFVIASGGYGPSPTVAITQVK